MKVKTIVSLTKELISFIYKRIIKETSTFGMLTFYY